MKTQDNTQVATPMLFPISPDQFWQAMRELIREEINQLANKNPASTDYHTPGLLQKPLYKMAELCTMLQVSKRTIYDWIKHGKLTPYKIRSRVYFLWQDVQKLIAPDQPASVIPLQKPAQQRAA